MGGAALETFMVYTGFYKVATRKAAEHRVEDRAMLQAAARRRRRLSDLRPGADAASSVPDRDAQENKAS